MELSPIIDAEEKLSSWMKLASRRIFPVILGSSTWAGEELALAEVTQRLILAGIQCLLLVPRHAERRGEIESN